MIQENLFKNDIKIMIIDGTNFAYRAGLVSGFSLSSIEGNDTTVLFAMLNMIRHQLDKHKPSDICVCWDWEGSKIKEAVFPEYKSLREIARKKNPLEKSLFADIGSQIIELQDVLPYFGVKQAKMRGVEADDIIGLLCEELQDVLVVSSDRDLLQLVDIGALVYYPPKDILVTKDNFQELFGVPPNLFLSFKSVLGDTSDNIPGLRGFGPKTSAKLVLKYGDFERWFAPGDGHNLMPEILEDLNKSQREEISKRETWGILTRNYALMKAGYFVQDLKDEILREFREQNVTFDQDEIERYFNKRQFNSFLARLSGWITPFALMAYQRSK